MNNVVCFRHPDYDPATPPDLSCRLCCQKYIGQIKETQEYFRSQKNFKPLTFTRKSASKDSADSGKDNYSNAFQPGRL